MKIIYIAHSTCILEINNKRILLDPFISYNPIFINDTNDIIKYYLSNKIDYILLTHAHYDHVCDVELFANNNPDILVISNYEIANFFSKKNIKTYGLNYGSFVTFPFGKLKYTWALHSSSFINGEYGGNPGGFLISTDEGNIYISGDTSLTYEMKMLPYFGKIILSILPIGGVFTMDSKDALIASNFLNCNKVLGVHYNTYKNIVINKNKSMSLFHKNKKELILLNPNTSIIVNK